MVEGFFKDKKGNVKAQKHSCASCGLYKNAETYKMKPYGGYNRSIINVGESPGQVEDEKGIQWQGKVGRILQRTYRRLGVDLFEDCLNVNSTNCHPLNNKSRL